MRPRAQLVVYSPITSPSSLSLLMGFLNGIPADIEEQAMSDVGVELVVGGILDDALLRGVLDGADTIFHLGARGSVVRSLVEPVEAHEVSTPPRGSAASVSARSRFACSTCTALGSRPTAPTPRCSRRLSPPPSQGDRCLSRARAGRPATSPTSTPCATRS